MCWSICYCKEGFWVWVRSVVISDCLSFQGKYSSGNVPQLPSQAAEGEAPESAEGCGVRVGVPRRLGSPTARCLPPVQPSLPRSSRRGHSAAVKLLKALCWAAACSRGDFKQGKMMWACWRSGWDRAATNTSVAARSTHGRAGRAERMSECRLAAGAVAPSGRGERLPSAHGKLWLVDVDARRVSACWVVRRLYLLLMSFLSPVGAWCRAVGSPHSLPRRLGASCASMSSKREKRASELSIPSSKKEELSGEDEWLYCLQNLQRFTFSPEEFCLGCCESWKSKRSCSSDFLVVPLLCFYLTFFPLVPGVKTASCTVCEQWTPICVMSL